MTEQEAINVLLENVPKCCKMVDGRYQGGFDDWDCEMGQAIRIAVLVLQDIQNYRKIGTVEECLKAMRKQKGMQVNEIHVDEYFCPACGSENNNGDIGCPGDHYCPICGQAIYW